MKANGGEKRGNMEERKLYVTYEKMQYNFAWLAKKLAKVWKRRRQKIHIFSGQTDRIKDIPELPID